MYPTPFWRYFEASNTFSHPPCSQAGPQKPSQICVLLQQVASSSDVKSASVIILMTQAYVGSTIRSRRPCKVTFLLHCSRSVCVCVLFYFYLYGTSRSLNPFCLSDACLYRRRISTARIPPLIPATLFVPLGFSQLLVFVLMQRKHRWRLDLIFRFFITHAWVFFG